MSNNSYEQPQTTSPSIQTTGQEQPTPNASSGSVNGATNPSLHRPGFHLDLLRPVLPQVVDFGTPITYSIPVFSRNTDHRYALPHGNSQDAAAASWESGGQMPVTIRHTDRGEVSYPPPHNPLSGGGYASLHILPSPVHATPQRGWQISDCWIEHKGVEEIHLVILCKRISAPPYSGPRVNPALQGVWHLSTCWIDGERGDEIKVVFSCLRMDLHGGSPVHQYT